MLENGLKHNQFCKRGHDRTKTLKWHGKQRYCEPCRQFTCQRQNLKREFGITLEQYNELFTQQKGLCLGCYKHQSEFKRALAVDHNHVTGKIRGLLCNWCNAGLGQLKENPEILERLAQYLRNRDA